MDMVKMRQSNSLGFALNESKRKFGSEINNVSIFIVTDTGDIIDPYEYEPNEMTGEFVMLTNDILNSEFGDDNSISIYRDWQRFAIGSHIPEKIRGYIDSTDGLGLYQTSNMYNGKFLARPKWQVDHRVSINAHQYNTYEEDYYDIDGYYNTNFFISNAPKLMKDHNDNVGKKVMDFGKIPSLEHFIPALMLAHHSTISFLGQELHGYIPAIKQLVVLGWNVSKVNKVLKMINSDILPDELNTVVWWSSSTAFTYELNGFTNRLYTYRFHAGLNGVDDEKQNDCGCCVLPLFRVPLR